MSENGIGDAGVEVVEVVATVEPGTSPKMPTADEIAKLFASMPKEQQEKIFQLGATLGAQVAATAGRPAVQQAAPTPIQAPVPAPAAPAPAPVPAPAAPAPAPAVVPPGPDFATVESPPGYVLLPEMAYLWTPQASEGIPLWGWLIQARAREGAIQGRLVLKLAKASYAMTRAGKRVPIPTGGFVMVMLSDALEPLVKLASNPEGCALLWIRALGEIADGVGGAVPALEVRWEPSNESVGQPRLYTRSTVMKSA